MSKSDSNSTINLVITFFGVIAIIFVVYYLFAQEQNTASINIDTPEETFSGSVDVENGTFSVEKEG